MCLYHFLLQPVTPARSLSSWLCPIGTELAVYFVECSTTWICLIFLHDQIEVCLFDKKITERMLCSSQCIVSRATWSQCVLVSEMSMFFSKISFIYVEGVDTRRVGTEEEGEGPQADSLLSVKPGCRAQSRDPEITTWTEAKSQVLDWLSYPSAACQPWHLV